MPTTTTFETIQDAAARVGVSTKTIRRRIAEGHLTGYRFGPHLIRLDPSEVDAVMRGVVITPGSVDDVPNAPKTPLRSFRIPDEVYRAAQSKAEAKGETVSDVVRRALERYAKRP